MAVWDLCEWFPIDDTSLGSRGSDLASTTASAVCGVDPE